jgi:hypothetical protein
VNMDAAPGLRHTPQMPSLHLPTYRMSQYLAPTAAVKV